MLEMLNANMRLECPEYCPTVIYSLMLELNSRQMINKLQYWIELNHVKLYYKIYIIEGPS